MFQLIQQENVLESREQSMRKDVSYYDKLPGQFEDV